MNFISKLRNYTFCLSVALSPFVSKCVCFEVTNTLFYVSSWVLITKIDITSVRINRLQGQLFSLKLTVQSYFYSLLLPFNLGLHLLYLNPRILFFKNHTVCRMLPWQPVSTTAKLWQYCQRYSCNILPLNIYCGKTNYKTLYTMFLWKRDLTLQREK